MLALKAAAEVKAGSPGALDAQARGIAHQLYENFGALDRRSATLPPDERAAMRGLRGFGVRFGKRSLFLPALLKPEAAALLALLWGIAAKLEKIPPPPLAGLTSFECDADVPTGFLAAAGFRVVGPRAIRLDMLERLEEELQAAAKSGASADAAMPKLVSLLGSDRAALDAVLAVLGWNRVKVESGETPMEVWREATPRVARARKASKKLQRVATVDTSSPFAGLKAMVGVK